MLVKTVSELSDEHPELLAEAQRLLQMMEQEFALLFSEAIRSGELNPCGSTIGTNSAYGIADLR